MANNIDVTPGTGKTVASEEISSTQYQQIKLIDATATSTAATGVAANPLQVSIANTGLNGTPIAVASHAVTNAGTFAVQATTVGTITPGTAATSLGKAEDAAHTSGDVGVMALGVRFDAGGSLSGADGDYSPLQVDANGALRVSGGGGGTEYTEDAAAAANPVGHAVIVVRDDARSGSITSADGDNIALRGTNTGEVYVKHVDAIPVTDNAGSLTVDGTVTAVSATAANLKAEVVGTGTFAVQATVAAAATNIAKAEDAASASADVGVPAMAVQLATPTDLAGTDADYAMLQMSGGRLWVSNTTTSVIPGVAATSLGKAEDAAHSSGDTGVMSLAVRNDVRGTLAGTDLDYAPLQLNSTGDLRTANRFVGYVNSTFSVQHNPAANTKATISQAAAGAGIKNVCTGFTVSLAAGASAPAAIQVTVQLVDGATTGTTYLWGPQVISLPATAGAMAAFVRSNIFIPGTANTAMTLEFSAAGGANTIESVSFEGTTTT